MERRNEVGGLEKDVKPKEKKTYGNRWRVVHRQVVLHQRKVRHICVHEGREPFVTILRDNEVPPPGEVFAIVQTLYLSDALVDRERDTIP